jgi:hypothetical protein
VALFKTLTAKPIAVPSAVVARANVGLSATAICKRAAELKQAVAVDNAALSATMTCRPPAVPAQTALTRHHLAARANAGSFKTQISKPIAAPPPAEVAANVGLSAIATFKPCAAPKQVAVAGNVDLFATTTCKQPAGLKLAKPHAFLKLREIMLAAKAQACVWNRIFLKNLWLE